MHVLTEQPVLQPADEAWFEVDGLDDNRYRKELEAKKNDNDYIAVYRDAGNTDWNSNPPHVSYQTIEYSQLRALIDNGERPISISCGALLICNESGTMLLHERAAYLHTYPGLRHIFGGRVHGERKGSDRRDDSCWAAMTREVHEETKIEDFGKRRLRAGKVSNLCGQGVRRKGGFRMAASLFFGSAGDGNASAVPQWNQTSRVGKGRCCHSNSKR